MPSLFPLQLVSACDVKWVNSVRADVFESGATSSRLIWPAQTFKRQFSVTTPPLSEAEFKYLRSFHSQRSGGYDSFWFRDNVHRTGNALVRFSAPPAIGWDGNRRVVNFTMDETAPIRALPEFDELATAAGNAPLLWWDANREKLAWVAGTQLNDSGTYDAYGQANRAVWQGGGTTLLGGQTSQYQGYLAQGGTVCAKLAANLSGFAVGTQPACTLFLIAQNAASAAQQVLCSVGATGAQHALGIQLTAANKYSPWVGAAETWATAGFTNSAASTWRSVAAVFAGSANTGALYVNAALIGTDTNTRSLTAGPAALHAAPDATLVAASGQSAHVLIFPAALTLAQIKAVHNLLGYQYGLASVP